MGLAPRTEFNERRRMIATKEKELVVLPPTTEKPDLQDFLGTYIRQRNEALATYEWIKGKLDGNQDWEWRRTIQSLETVCKALDAGFDPITPPRNWASGQLLQYLAPIPEQVRKAIDKAEPVFEQAQILIYDPNREHFARPRKTDPMAVGFVDLADNRLHFLIGLWDLAADLKFIKGSKRFRQARRNVDDVIRAAQPNLLSPTPWAQGEFSTMPTIQYNSTVWSDKAAEWNNLSVSPSAAGWVAKMTNYTTS